MFPEGFLWKRGCSITRGDDLIVRAPIDGQLTSLDAEIGQNKNKGENGLLLELNLGWNHLRKKGALAIAKGSKMMLLEK